MGQMKRVAPDDGSEAPLATSSVRLIGMRSLDRIGRPDIGLAGRFGGALTWTSASGVNMGIQGDTSFRRARFTELSVSSSTRFLASR